MQKYEVMLLVPANEHNEKSAKEVIKEFIWELEKLWWKIFFDEFWWVRKLAYKINWNTEGFYQVLNFEIDSTAISKLETWLNINTNIVRFLFTKISDNYKPFTLEELKAAEEERYRERLAKKSKGPRKEKINKNKEKKKEKEVDKKIEKIVEWK